MEAAGSQQADLVRSVWRETLGSDSFDDDTGFFEAGGDSLLLLVLIEKLTAACGVKLRAIDVLRAGTIRGQAALLAGRMSAASGKS
jgi:Phosphopantetheine attachment site